MPVVDWGVRARPYRAPVAVEPEFRSLDRDAALTALRMGGSADASLVGLGVQLDMSASDLIAEDPLERLRSRFGVGDGGAEREFVEREAARALSLAGSTRRRSSRGPDEIVFLIRSYGNLEG